MKTRIKELREKQKLTQKELGKLVDLDRTTVSKHEEGTRGIDSSTIKKYAEVFKIETHELFVNPDDLVSDPL